MHGNRIGQRGGFYEVDEIIVFLLLAYFVLVGVLVGGMHRWERAIKIPGYGG